MREKCKKGGCLAVFFCLMFLSGWGIARLQSGKLLPTNSIAAEAENWGLGFGAEGMQPTGNATADELKEYDAYYVGDAGEKVIYLTFDCG